MQVNWTNKDQYIFNITRTMQKMSALWRNNSRAKEATKNIY